MLPTTDKVAHTIILMSISNSIDSKVSNLIFLKDLQQEEDSFFNSNFLEVPIKVLLHHHSING